MLTNPVGMAVVSLYGRVSPPLAEFIARHEALRIATRWALTPVVYGVEHPGAASMVVFGLAGAAVTFLARIRARKA
jgi:hypothetical protein